MAIDGDTTGSLFGEPARERLSEGAHVLRGFALGMADELARLVAAVAEEAPFRRMATPGGRPMSIAVTSCGSVGWITDHAGYRYSARDPATGGPWPAMPAAFLDLAGRAAAEAGFRGFVPDSCLVNEYRPGDRLGLHQDRDEEDMSHPIVSVSLGLPAVFLWGGLGRSEPVRKVALRHGDVVAWGGPARLVHHGVEPLAAGPGWEARHNLTFRRAG